MNLPLIIYLFRDSISPAEDSVVCLGEKTCIEAALGTRHVEDEFQGSVLYRNDKTKQDYLGVWGARNASRLRGLLRERGFDLTIERKFPHGARLRSANRIYKQEVDPSESVHQ